MDITDEKSILNTSEEIRKRFSHVDILVNNVAVHSSHPLITGVEPPTLEELNFENIKQDYLVNELGPLQVIKHFLELVRDGDTKLIVNISSEAGSITNAWRKKEFVYCMSKAGLNMRSKILQNYLKDENIKILVIHLGWFSSDMGGQNAPISPDEAANMVLFTIIRDWNIDDQIYIDAKDGSKIAW